jgi:hypothetical protein
MRSCILLGISMTFVYAQTSSKLTGRVIDPSGRGVPAAAIQVRNVETEVHRIVTSNAEGMYEVPALPVGTYRLQVRVPGFRLYTVENVTMDVSQTVILDLLLEIGDISQEVTVASKTALIDAATSSVGQVTDRQTVQEIPLNGRYFLDLAVLAVGSVTPSQKGFSTPPFRGLGALAINTAGNREDAVNYLINGITLNDQLYSSIDFQPSISTIEEFKIDNSSFGAEFGQNSGAVVNVATRSGTNQFHGELFEFLRNDALDARNFFTLTSSEPPPFKRNQFGFALGGPIYRNRSFFFLSYEGLRQAQDLPLNSVVLNDSQRASAVDPVIAKLIELIPRANYIDSAGTLRFIGSAPAPVGADQWALDISHNLGQDDQVHAYYNLYRTQTLEPTGQGTSIPGFGYIQRPLRQFFSLNETHTLGHRVNELRVGFNRIHSTTKPNAQLNPADFGIRDGIAQPIGLPQINIAGGGLNFGGPSTFPSGRGDTNIVLGDALSCLCGRHSLKIGGEFRQFFNNNFRLGTGAFSFPSIAAFLMNDANSFSVTLGNQSSSIVERALSFYVQTSYKWRPNLTWDLGIRYDWNMTPHERYGRFIVFDPFSDSLVRLSEDDDIYKQNNQNFQPRLGFSWDPFKHGTTAIRGSYGIFVSQPITNVVVGTAGNPPLANPLTFTGTIQLDNAIELAQATGLAPATVDHGFENGLVQSWNLTVQRELAHNFAVMAGYFGSKAAHLIIQRNINQPDNGARPFPAVSQTSTVLPGTPLGNIMQTESTGNSNYNALWVTASRPFAGGLQIHASYTWSKSLDYNSLSSQGVVVQDSYNLRGDRGLSDFDALQRFVFAAIYDLPSHHSRLTQNWQVSVLVQAQSGNPVNIVMSNSTITGVGNTLRPNVVGPIRVAGSVDHWFDTSVFLAGSTFGNLGRNVVIGPGFNNTDFSIIKNTDVNERMRVQFRAEIFDLLNHANLGQPGNVMGSPGFGRITSTRLPTGESGSSRQVQFGIKLIF